MQGERRLIHLKLALSIALFSVVISSGTFAADAESLPAAEEGTPQGEQECLQRLQAFDQELAEAGFGVLPPGGYGISAPAGYYSYDFGATPREKINALRSAAYVYAMDGKRQSCNVVLESMREAYEKHQELVETEADDPNVRAAWRRAHLANARPISGMNSLMRADLVIGAEIRNTKDERLGTIEDLVLDPAEHSVTYVLATRGGFLGLGGKMVALRWTDLRATDDHELYVLRLPKLVFDMAPTVNRSNFKNTVDPNWRRELDQFWDENLAR